MDSELIKLLTGNPIAGGGTVVGGVLALLYMARKAYNALKQDSATSDAVTMSLDSQTKVITLLREEVSRLSEQVANLQTNMAQHSEDRRHLTDQIVQLQRALADCQADTQETS